MAAVLKKRVIAEFSQTIQEEVKVVPPKRLRLVHRSKLSEPQLDLQNASSSHEVMQILLRYRDQLPVSMDTAPQHMQVLMNHFCQEAQSAVRAEIAAVIGDLAKTPCFNATHLLNDVKSMLTNEKSHKVIAQLLWALVSIGRSAPQDIKLHQQIVLLAVQNLKDSSHIVRSKCLDMIGALGSPDLNSGQSEKSLASILLDYTHDDDPRVRTCAFLAMLLWHQRGIKLEQAIYRPVCSALSDDHEGVRIAALKLVSALSHIYPESLVKLPDSDEEIRLVDDGFAQICQMVNDSHMVVRTEAASLLGSLHQVSRRFLEQTLDKKLMSNMRRKRSAHERQKEHFESGEWSTGQKWADDAPKEEVDATAVVLMSSGACGAFVHGLEDEYMEVRNAAMDSLCELSTHSVSFTQLAQDYLVDMFNDEIESVRLNAINSLRKISHNIILRQDQLDMMLSLFKDFNYEIRDALREMFCMTRLATKACLHMVAMALLENMKRYPEDRTSVWQCMKEIGSRNATLVLPLVPELLSQHPYFDSPEPDMDDPAYISILVLVFNAAVDLPTMTALFPEHTLRHYAYLRDTLPHLVPPLKLVGVREQTENRLLSNISQQGTVMEFMRKTLQRLSDLPTLVAAHVRQLLTMAIRDLERIGEVEQTLGATAKCMAIYLQCQLDLLKLMSSNHWTLPLVTGSQDIENNSSLINKVLLSSYEMENMFVGLGLTDLSAIRQLRLRAASLHLLAKLRTSPAENKTSCVQYLQMLNQLQGHLKSNKLETDSFTQALMNDMHRLETCEPPVFLHVIQGALPQHRPSYLQLDNSLRRLQASIIEPSSSSDNVTKFTAGIATAPTLIAELENVEDLNNVRIQVRFPDQQRLYVAPPKDDFRQLSPLRHRLHTKVILSHNIWSEPCSVELSLVLVFNPDKDIQGQKTDISKVEVNSSNVLELSKAVQVLIHPKPVAR